MNYRPEIDGLRAFAVLPVILFHAGFESFSGGFVGVDVFFVISGYLITTNILTAFEQDNFSIVNFYESRARRIFPALFLVMLTCIPFAWILLPAPDINNFFKSLIAISIFVSNIFFWKDGGYFASTAELKPLLHTWSLAVEEQFYFLFPLFLILFWKLGKRTAHIIFLFLFIISLSLAQWGSYSRPDASFYLLPTRGWELLIGTFTAFYLSNKDRKVFDRILNEIFGWLGLSLIFYAIFFFSKSTPFPGIYALVPTLGAALIILFGTQQTYIGKFLGNKVLLGIGLISYSAYLWHLPVFAYARHLNINIDNFNIDIYYLLFLVLILSILSWKFVEIPFRNKDSQTYS